MPRLKTKILCLTILMLFVANIGVAQAKKDRQSNSYKFDQRSSHYQSQTNSKKYSSSYAPNAKRNQNSFNDKPRYAQAKVRSRSDVMSEVKSKYNAKVLKISLNEKAGVYNVRMLMPNGKVRSIQVSAR